jgi:hypothetical protein
MEEGLRSDLGPKNLGMFARVDKGKAGAVKYRFGFSAF